MNAIYEDHHLQLDYVLKTLYTAINGSSSNTIKDVLVVFRVQEPEELNDYLYTFSVLQEKKVIEGYEPEASNAEDVESDFGRMSVYATNFKIKLKPRVLVRYMTDESYIPKYRLEFDDVQSKVILNEKYVLSKPDFDGVSYNFLSYAIKKSGKIIRKEDFSKDAGQKNIKKIINRDIRSILENLLKNNELIKVFFPHISMDSTYFRNNVTTKDLSGQRIREKDIELFLKTDKRITQVKPHKDTLKHL